jgi:hypothetical protein
MRAHLMTRTVTVRWEVTEQHQETVDVDDDFDEDEVDSNWLAEIETNATYTATTERTLLEITTNDTKDN